MLTPDSVPEHVLLVLPPTVRLVDAPEGPTTTLPPPASDSISTKAPLPSVIVAPVLTVKEGRNEELLDVPPLVVNVKVAPLCTVNE
jgi:hypothetical protein